jgi:hypothetical protein
MRLLDEETSIAEKVQIAIRSTSSNAIPFRLAVGAHRQPDVHNWTERVRNSECQEHVVRLEGEPNQTAELGQNRIPKSTGLKSTILVDDDDPVILQAVSKSLNPQNGSRSRSALGGTAVICRCRVSLGTFRDHNYEHPLMPSPAHPTFQAAPHRSNPMHHRGSVYRAKIVSAEDRQCWSNRVRGVVQHRKRAARCNAGSKTRDREAVLLRNEDGELHAARMRR